MHENLIRELKAERDRYQNALQRIAQMKRIGPLAVTQLALVQGLAVRALSGAQIQPPDKP